MSISLQYFLYAYYAFLSVWALFFAVGLFHMLKYGFKTFLSVFTTAIFIAVALAMLLASFYYIDDIDNWDETIQVLPEFNSNSLEL